MPKISLEDAVAVVNTTERGPTDPPLIKTANCDTCSAVFAMLPQDFSRAEVHGQPKLCRGCAVERRRESRRVKP